jgi:hypothetical protein
MANVRNRTGDDALFTPPLRVAVASMIRLSGATVKGYSWNAGALGATRPLRSDTTMCG